MSQSEENVAMDSCSDSDLVESDEDIVYYEDLYEETASSVHDVLMKDIELLTETNCNGAVKCRSFDALNEMDIDIILPKSILPDCVINAWGLLHSSPITIRINLNQKHYFTVKTFHRVEVFQESSVKKPTAVLCQLKSIAEEFCRKSFRELTNEMVESAVSKNLSLSATGVKNNTPSAEEMTEILQMGFAEEDILKAYRHGDGTKEGAIYFLCHQQDGGHTKATSDLPEETKKTCTPEKAATDNPKEMPGLERGFLVQFYHYMTRRLISLNDFCPVCDESHSLKQPMMKPVVCSKPLCIFSFQTLGVMAEVAESLDKQPKVVCLLVHMTRAAVMSPRRGTVLAPYPCIVHPKKIDEMAIDAEKRDDDFLKYLLENLPLISRFAQMQERTLKQFLDSIHILCYPLLRWIISSNRSHIEFLPEEQQLNFMDTEHQFLLINSPPKEEAKFQQLKEKYGSVFAFHGSPIENWHSIVREGLVVGTGTEKQLHGASYGKGIYLSPSLHTSMAYSTNGRSWSDWTAEKAQKLRYYKEKNKNKEKDRLKDYIHVRSELLCCIALCEVITSPGLKKHKSVWIIDDSKFVCIRFFFLYDCQYVSRSHTASRAVDVSLLSYHQRILSAIEECCRR